METETLKLCVEAAVKSDAYLQGAYLRGADLQGAYLQGADLRGADFQGADLRGAYLRDAEIIFNKFPSIKMLASIDLGKLSDGLSLELMRRDAAAHPYPERFDIWANGGECPYQNEERFWIFDLKRDLWKPGKPEMTDVELIRAICKEKGWGIDGAQEA